MVYHSIFWIIIAIFTYFLEYRLEKPVDKLLASIFSVTLAASTFYFHLYFFNNFYLQRKYFYYGIGVILILLIFGLLENFFYNLIYNESIFIIWDILQLVFLLAALTGMKFFKDGLNEKYQLQELKAQKLELELSSIKSQINPHFLFNTLNNLYSLSLQNSEKTPEMVLRLSEIMRFMFDSAQEQKIPLDKEIQYIRNYIELEKLRLGNKAKIEINVSGLNKFNEIAPMLLISFVENAFKHGFDAISEQILVITIDISIQNNHLYFSIENTKGKNPKVISTGKGIENAKKLLNLLYFKKHSIVIENSETEYKLFLELEL